MCGQPRPPCQDAKRDAITSTSACGTANVFCAVEPKARRHFTFATPDRSGFEFAQVAVTLALAYCRRRRKTGGGRSRCYRYKCGVGNWGTHQYLSALTSMARAVHLLRSRSGETAQRGIGMAQGVRARSLLQTGSFAGVRHSLADGISAQKHLLVPNVLLLAIPLDGLRVLLAILPPVIGVAGAPFLRTVEAYLAVFRIRGDLLAVIIGAAPPLAGAIAAHRLRRLKLRQLEDSLAIPTPPLIHTDSCRARGAQCDLQAGNLETAIESCTASSPMAGFLRLHDRRHCCRFIPRSQIQAFVTDRLISSSCLKSKNISAENGLILQLSYGGGYATGEGATRGLVVRWRVARGCISICETWTYAHLRFARDGGCVVNHLGQRKRKAWGIGIIGTARSRDDQREGTRGGTWYYGTPAAS
jgi:hypothetical protein